MTLGKEMKRKMLEGVISPRNFLLYVVFMLVTPFTLKKLDSMCLAKTVAHVNIWHEEPGYTFYFYLQMNRSGEM